MNIAVDIDDVLADLISQLILFHNETYGTKFQKNDFCSYTFEEVCNCTPAESIKKVNEFIASVYFKQIIPNPGAQMTLEALKSSGHDLYCVSGRKHSLLTETIEWVNKFFPNIISGIHLTNSYAGQGERINKSHICHQLKVQLIIEDDLLHITDCAQAGIPILVYNQPWNQGILPQSATRIQSWSEIMEKIKN